MRTIQAWVWLAVLGATMPAAASPLTQQVDTYVAAHQKEIVGELDALVRLRSVAADRRGLDATAANLEAALQRRGFAATTLTVAGSVPVVFGSFAVPGAKRTVMFYAHYDGQPVTPSEWASDPFTPVMRTGPLNSGERTVEWKTEATLDPEWRLFGRAVADDKASIVAFLAAFDALQAIGRTPSVNIKVLWEGEEEAGSPSLGKVLRADRAQLASDLWLIGDGPVHQSRRRMIAFGARGVLDVEMTVYGPLRALHDGHYGNWVPNPAARAADLIADLRSPDGRILVSGFLDDVRPVTQAEADAVAALPPVEDQLRREFGIAAAETGEAVSAVILRPALNIRGIRAGQVGAQAANAIPIEATVSIDFRLVPDQTPAHVRATVEAYLKSHGWTVVHDEPDLATRLAHPQIVRLAWGQGYPSLRTDMTSPAAQAVIAVANGAAGSPVAILPTMGGSVPIYMFHETFGVPVISVPIVNHDNSQHAADENLRLQNLWDGIGTYAAMMGELNW